MEALSKQAPARLFLEHWAQRTLVLASIKSGDTPNGRSLVYQPVRTFSLLVKSANSPNPGYSFEQRNGLASGIPLVLSQNQTVMVALTKFARIASSGSSANHWSAAAEQSLHLRKVNKPSARDYQLERQPFFHLAINSIYVAPSDNVSSCSLSFSLILSLVNTWECNKMASFFVSVIILNFLSKINLDLIFFFLRYIKRQEEYNCMIMKTLCKSPTKQYWH